MATTFLKRQKEMKRQEKQREKAERRAQRKLTGGTGNEISDDNSDVFGDDTSVPDGFASAEPDPAQG
jgi:hypothetical protein